jgi:transcription antitermination factor NusG
LADIWRNALAPPSEKAVQNQARNGVGLNERSFALSALPDGVVVLPRRAAHSEIEPKPPDWFALRTRYRFEKRVTEQLTAKGIEVFLPLRRESHRWSDRQKVITVPLFPGYAFVHLEEALSSRRTVLKTAGLIGFVNFRGTAAAVPPKQIDDLRLLLSENVPFALYPFVQIGQRVRIRGGCLNGLEGILSHEKGKLVISIDSIQRSLAIEIHGYELELV